MKTASMFLLMSILLFASMPVFADNLQLPQGWRYPSDSEIADKWREQDNDKYILVNGDFNGDGNPDEARILARKDGRGIGLFVFLGQKGQKYKSYLLNEMEDKDSIHAMGVRKVLPGRYRTACGKGYWACEKDEPSEISTRYDAIDYFKVESASSYFYWDSKAKAFKRVWISD